MRIQYLDNLKGFAILLVVLGHCVQSTVTGYDDNPIFKVIYSFHMPLFFMISGYVSYKYSFSWRQSVSKRAYQLLVPYCIWGGMKCILSDIPIYKIFVDVGDFAWFIWTLFFINLIIVSLHKCFEKSEYLDLILFTSVAIIMGLTFMSPNNIMGVKNIGTELQYFVIGYLLKRHDVVEKGKKWHGIILWPMFLLLLFGWHRQHSIFFENSLNGILNEIYVITTVPLKWTNRSLK